ncbi:MAG: T9SS type A sorting domain-containing protein [Bacteroidia bacterium]
MLRIFIITAVAFTSLLAQGQEKWNHWPCVERIKQIDQSQDYIWINGYAAITKIHKKYGLVTQWGQDKEPLLDAGVGKLFVSSNNSVYAWNGAGSFFEYKDNAWEQKDIKNTYFSEGHSRFVVDKNSELWVADTALFHFDGNDWEIIHYPNIESFSQILDIKIHQNELYIITKDDVYIYSLISGFIKYASFKSSMSKYNYLDMQFDEKDNAWVLFDKEGLFKSENGNFRLVLNVPSDAINGFSCFYVESSNSVWLGTAQDRAIGDYKESGVYHYSNKPLEFISRENSGLDLSDMLAMVKDQFGVFWFAGVPVAASSIGLISKKGNDFKPINYAELPVLSPNISHIGHFENGFYTFSHNFGIPWVNSLSSKIDNNWYHKTLKKAPYAVTNDEKSIILKMSDSIKIYDKQCVFEKAIANYQPYDEYNSLLFTDSENRIWCDYGVANKRFRWNLQFYENGAWKKINELVNGLPDSYFLKADFNSAGDLFIATDSAIYSFNNNYFKLLTTLPENLPKAYKIDFEIDVEGNFWFNGADGDLFKYDGTAWTYLENPIYPYSGFEYHLESDSKGAIWLAMSGRFLYKYYNNQWTEYTTLQTPFSQGSNVECLYIDENDNLWMGCNLGVFHLNDGGLALEENNLTTHNLFSVYPNPFYNELVLNHHLPNKEIQITIFDNIGRLAFTDNIYTTESSSIIKVTLKSGCYVLLLQVDDKKEYYKILRE